MMRLLDLFCGAGGAAMGYHRAGFEVVGVDIKPQRHYPFEFHQADALEFLAEHGRGFDVIHASPPCQAYTALRSLQPGKEYPDLGGAVRTELAACRKAWVIENVPGSPLRRCITLCGTMFGLRVYRHRLFESSEMLWQPQHPEHIAKTSTKKRRRDFAAGMFISVTGDVGRWVGPACMGIDWMTGDELSQAIPPAYTEYIGSQLFEVLK
jgi:DNA (cytosine-5)-methyltransferase 1